MLNEFKEEREAASSQCCCKERKKTENIKTFVGGVGYLCGDFLFSRGSWNLTSANKRGMCVKGTYEQMEGK
jgi:hypothetical protein